MDMLDKRLSGPIFRLQLGTVLECLLSVRSPLACLVPCCCPNDTCVRALLRRLCSATIFTCVAHPS